MFTRTCDSCGVEYEAKRANSRFHSDTCRKRHQRGARAAVVAIASVDTPSDVVGAVERAVRAELQEAGRLATFSGQGAVALACRIDEGRDTGAGLASLMKQLHATMETALAGADEEADPIDELRAWRDRKRSAAR